MSCVDILDDKATLDTPTFYTNQTASKKPIFTNTHQHLDMGFKINSFLGDNLAIVITVRINGRE